MADHPMVALAKKRDRFTRTELATLCQRAASTVDQWRMSKRIAYDVFEGRRRWFSSTAVVHFLLSDFLAAPAQKVDA